jgi:hypothetical protein
MDGASLGELVQLVDELGAQLAQSFAVDTSATLVVT